jgi:uncharacterized protein
MRHLLRLCTILALSIGMAQAVDFAALKPQGYVSDFAGVVDGNTKAALEKYCTVVESSTGAQIALVTLPTLAGEPVEDVANLLFRKWGVGRKETDEGILLLLVIQDRRSRMEVGYGLEPYIPDGFAGSILREMRPALREERYGEALLAAAQAIGSRIAEAKGVALQVSQPLPRRPRRTAPIPWGTLLGGLVMLFWLLGVGGRGRGYGGNFLMGMLLGSFLGRGTYYRGRGGGGFGGFDSGDGFGGFGGGDSGGGGASSSW